MVACASLGWDEVGWSRVGCAGKEAAVLVHLFKEEQTAVCDRAMVVMLS
jgi:hypothetical protein